MSKVELLEKEILGLDDTEFAKLRDWFAELEEDRWDRQIEADIHAGKLDALADEALAAHRAGKSTPL